jgi:4-amino-4-deoxy-L-arabinose transferase-like glycosyltransferase
MGAWMNAAHGLGGAAAAAAVAISSLALARRLGVAGPVRAALAAAVLACAQIVLAVEALSLLGSVRFVPLLVFHLAVAAPFVRRPPGWIAGRSVVLGAWRAADVPLRVLAVATACAGVSIALKAVLVPVSHDDSLVYHLPRAVLYLQQGSLDAFPTPDLRQTALPANAEILVLWQFAMLGGAWAPPLEQTLAWLGATLAVFRLARDVGAPGRSAAFAALAFASLPGVLLQATTNQNDLTTAFFVVCALTFARSGLAGARAGELVVAGAALGLALGTKATAVLAVPTLALLVLAESVRARRLLRRETALLAAACAAGILTLGAYVYVQNLRRYGHPTGSAAFADLGALPGIDPRIAWANLVRLTTRLGEPAGLVPVGTRPAAWLESAHARFAAAMRRAAGVEQRLPSDFFRGQGPEPSGFLIHPDTTTFGPLWAIAGVPVLALAALGRRPDPAARALALGACAYLVGLAALLRYNVHLGRFLVTMVAIAAPLLATLYVAAPRRPGRAWNLLLTAVCLGTLATCVAFRDARLLVRTIAVRGAPPRPLVRPTSPKAEVAARLLDRLPPGGVALVAAGIGEPLFLLFDERFSRRVRVVRAGGRGDSGAAALRDSDYLLLWGETQYAMVEGAPLPQEWPWFELYDLAPTLRGIRGPGSGWHPIVDGALYPPGSFHLFGRRPLSRADVSGLPDLLPASPPQPEDGWRGRSFAVPVRLDPDRPVLVVTGEVEGSPAIDVRGPAGERLARLAPRPGLFEGRIALDPLILTSRTPYAVLTFDAELSADPTRGDPGRRWRWRAAALAGR